MAVFDNWAAGQTYTANDQDNTAKGINGSGWMQPCHAATTGSETYTISAGTVTVINGTTLDGVSVSVGDRILIKDAPFASGTGSSFSSQPGNGVYQVSSNTTNLAVARVYEMSSSPPSPYVPAGASIAVTAGTANLGRHYTVTTPSTFGAFTYGSGSIAWTLINPLVGTGLTQTGQTIALSSTAQTDLALAVSALQSVSSTSLSDSTSTGRSLITAANAAAVWTIVKPSGGVSSTDMTSAVQTTLGLANSALQSVTSASLSDSTSTGRSLITAANAAAALSTVGGAEAGGKYIVAGTSDSTLSGAQFLGALGTGLVKNTTSTGVLSIAASGTDYAPATSGSAILKGNGSGGFSSATASTDYAPATSGSAILKGNGSGGFSSTTSGTDYAPATATTSALKGNGSGGFSAATLTDVGAPTASFSMNSHLLTSLSNGVSAQDATTVSQVQGWLQGISSKYSAEAATVGTETFTVASGSVTTINGTSIDGVALNVNDYVLIKDAPAATGTGSAGSTQPGNGLYQVTSNTTNLSVSRAADMTGAFSPVGAFVFVAGGTANASSGWIVSAPTTTAAFTYGTNNIAWTQYSQTGTILAGTGLFKSGSTISIENSGVLLPTHGGTGVATITGLVKGNGTSNFSAAVSATDYAPATTGSSILKASSGGFANAVSGTDYAPATTGSSILKASSGGFANAVSGTDYAPATGLTSALKGNGSGGFSAATLNDVGAATASYSLNSKTITSLGSPVNSTDAANKLYADSGAYHPSCRVTTTGTETFTVTSGVVTTINGTTLDGVTVAIGDRILIKDSPGSTGTGSVLSSQPGNGIYTVTANTTNLSVSRATDMSSGGAITTPAGSAVIVMAGTNAMSSWRVSSPSSAAAFTYGTTAISWVNDVVAGSGLSRTGNTLSTAAIPLAALSATGTPTAATVLTGNWAWTSFTQAAVPEVVSVVSGTSQTLSTTVTAYVFSGSSAATWTLPSVSGNANARFILDNRGTAVVNVVPAGSDHIFHTASVTSIVLGIGNSHTLINDGTYWNSVSVGAVTDGEFILQNAADTTKQAVFSLTSISTANKRTYTLPDTNDTLVTLAATQTLTNKTINGASGNTFTNIPLSTAVTGNLAVGNLNTGTGASSATFWRGDGTWSAPISGGLTWTNVTGTGQTAVAANGYLANNAGLVTVTLPSTCAAGDVVRVGGAGAGGWKVAQTSGVNIVFGPTTTTTGTSGYLASTQQYDSVELIAVVANTTWSVIGSTGNVTVF